MFFILFSILLLMAAQSMELSEETENVTSTLFLKRTIEHLKKIADGIPSQLPGFDLPDEYYKLFRKHEKKMLGIMTDKMDMPRLGFSRDSFEELPLDDILDFAFSGDQNPEILRMKHTGEALFVHFNDFIPIDPLALHSAELLSRSDKIYKAAQKFVPLIRERIVESRDSGSAIYEVYVSGHMSGTAAAQLVTLSLECERELLGSGLNIFCIGFGEHQFFSKEMSKSISKLPGFDWKRFIVFRSIEHYFSPNFANRLSFGNVISMSVNAELRLRDNRALIDQILSSDDGLSEIVLLQQLIENMTSAEFFRRYAVEAYNDANRPVVEVEIMEESFETMMLDDFFQPADPGHVEAVLSAATMRLSEMFKKYFKCFQSAEYYLTVSVRKEIEFDGFVTSDSFREAIFSINDRRTGRTINFCFRIFPWQRDYDRLENHSMLRALRQLSSMHSVEEGRKDRNRYGCWQAFFQSQWSRLSGEGVRDMKKLSPFFEESVMFEVGISNCVCALIADTRGLLSIFLEQDAETVRFVRDVFGPKKRQHYLHFPSAQKLFRTPSSTALASSGISSMIPGKGELFDVVKRFFEEFNVPVETLLQLKGASMEMGSFSVREIASGHVDKLVETKLTTNDILKGLKGMKNFHQCNLSIPAKHCPILSLRTPTNPFWKRVRRIQDIYLSYTGSSMLSYGMKSKLDMILEHMGVSARRVPYSRAGCYTVLEVYSKSIGFGPCSQQGVFYLLFLQDPPTIE